MFTVREIHDNAFGGIGDRYSHYIDPYHFLGRNAMDDAIWGSQRAKSNVLKDPNHYQIEIAVPGFSKDEINVNLVNDHVVVECTKTDLKDKVPSQIHREFGHNQISRSFALPKEVDQEGIKSHYRNGILHITLPIVKGMPRKSVAVL